MMANGRTTPPPGGGVIARRLCVIVLVVFALLGDANAAGAQEKHTPSGAVAALKARITEVNERQWSESYRSLYPTQRQMISMDDFTACMSQEPEGVVIDEFTLVGSHAERATIPGGKHSVKTLAIEFRATTAYGDITRSDTATVHEIYVGGAWRWALSSGEFDRCRQFTERAPVSAAGIELPTALPGFRVAEVPASVQQAFDITEPASVRLVFQSYAVRTMVPTDGRPGTLVVAITLTDLAATFPDSTRQGLLAGLTKNLPTGSPGPQQVTLAGEQATIAANPTNNPRFVLVWLKVKKAAMFYGDDRASLEAAAATLIQLNR